MLTVTLAGLRARWRRLLLSALAVALGVAFIAGTLINTATVHAAYYSQFAAQAKNVDAAVEPAKAGPCSRWATSPRSARSTALPKPRAGCRGPCRSSGQPAAPTPPPRRTCPRTLGSVTTPSCPAAATCSSTRTPPRSTT